MVTTTAGEDDDLDPDEFYKAMAEMSEDDFLDYLDGLTEPQVICDYLEDAYPAQPLYPRDPLARAQVRELIQYIELHMELVARRLYREVFFGGKVSDEAKKEVERELAKGVRSFAARARFEPYVAGKELTLADCSAYVHLPLVSMASKLAFGRDFLDGLPQVKPYIKMLGERAVFARVNEDRKAAQAATAGK